MKRIIELFIILVLLAVFIFLGKDKLAAYYCNRGNTYYDQHLYKDAIVYFKKSLWVNSSIAMTHYALANAYMEEKMQDCAIEEYRKAIQFDRHLVWAYNSLADVYIRRKSYEEAIGILKKAEIIIPDNQEIKDSISYASLEYTAYLLSSGVDAYLEADKTKAYELLNKALQINPDFSFTYYVLGYFYFNERKYDEALVMLNEAVRLYRDFFLAHRLMGDIYFEKKVFNKAIDEYKLALSINRNDSSLLTNLGLAFMNLENYNQAIPFLKEALSLNPRDVNIRYGLASVYRDEGMLNEAIAEFNVVVNTQSDYPNIHNDLGDIYKEQGLLERAQEEYYKEIYFCRNRLANNPIDPFLLTNMSHAYNGIKEYDKAKEFIDKAIIIKPDYREAYLTLADIYRNISDTKGALAALEKAKGLSSQRYSFIDKAIADTKKLKILIGDSVELSPVDTIYLKNGRHLEGRIKKETKDSVILEIKAGSSIGTITLSRDTIERIVNNSKTPPSQKVDSDD